MGLGARHQAGCLVPVHRLAGQENRSDPFDPLPHLTLLPEAHKSRVVGVIVPHGNNHQAGP